MHIWQVEAQGMILNPSQAGMKQCLLGMLLHV